LTDSGADIEKAMSNATTPFQRVYMIFMLQRDWLVSFLNDDLTTSPLKTLTFADPEEIRQLALTGQALGTSEAQLLFDYAIGRGGGGLYLEPTPEQYSQLRRF
jgi:hypothetical protein